MKPRTCSDPHFMGRLVGGARLPCGQLVGEVMSKQKNRLSNIAVEVAR